MNWKAGMAIQGILNRSTVAEMKTWLPVWERGVYNFYLKRKGGKRQASAAAAETIEKELNAASDAPEARADPAEGVADEAMEEAIEEVEESVRPKLVKAEDPTQEEIDEREATGHVIYRSWCRHCIAGRAIGQPRRTRSEEQKAWCQLWHWITRSCHAAMRKKKERNRS